MARTATLNAKRPTRNRLLRLVTASGAYGSRTWRRSQVRDRTNLPPTRAIRSATEERTQEPTEARGLSNFVVTCFGGKHLHPAGFILFHRPEVG
jgi:hypothetical protein